MTRTDEKLLQDGIDNLLWFNQNLATLKTRYDNQFIAIMDKSVVANAPTLEKLRLESKRKNIDISNATIERISKIRQIL